MIDTRVHHHKQRKIEKNKCWETRHAKTIFWHLSNPMWFCDNKRRTICNGHIPDLSEYHEWTIYKIPWVETEKSPNIDTIDPKNEWKRNKKPCNSSMKLRLPVIMHDFEWCKSTDESSNRHYRNIDNIKMEHIRKLSEMDKIRPNIERIRKKDKPS